MINNDVLFNVVEAFLLHTIYGMSNNMLINYRDDPNP